MSADDDLLRASTLAFSPWDNGSFAEIEGQERRNLVQLSLEGRQVASEAR
jgi:hypothetical protein